MTTKQIKAASLCFIFFISTLQLAASPAGNDNISKIVSELEAALKERSLDKLQECIAPDFSVSVATLPSALKYASAILEKSPEIDSVRLVSVFPQTTAGKAKTMRVAFYAKGKNAEFSNISFDDGDKIRYIDYFDRLYGMFRDKPAKLRAVVPFEMDNGSIIVQLKLNDSARPLRFLFDTGADGMAIAKHLADSVGLVVSHEQNTSVVGTNRNITVSSGNTVHLDTLSIPGQNIALFEDMDAYEGIIGLNLAKAFITKVDFQQKKIFLYDMGDYTHAGDETVLPVTVPDGVIHIPAQLDLLGKGAVPGNFIFDTGAKFHVVAFSPFVRKNRLLLGGFKYESQNSMLSLGHATQVYNGKATRFSFGGLHFDNLPISLQASSGDANWDLGAAGSIGIQLIKGYNFTIDLVKKALYLKKVE